MFPDQTARLEPPRTPLDPQATWIEVDGIQRPVHMDHGIPIHWSVEGIRNFWRWFESSALTDAEQRPVMLYHGTTRTFHQFDPQLSSVESDLGAGLYFTNSPDDMSANYAGMGGDLRAKIEQLAEEEWSSSDEDLSLDEIKAQVTGRLMDHDGMGLPVFLRMEHPVILDSNQQSGRPRTFLDYHCTFDSEEGDEEVEESGRLVEFIQALELILWEDRYAEVDVPGVFQRVRECLLDAPGLYADEVISRLNGLDELGYVIDCSQSSGLHLCRNDILRRAFESLGFDGLIDYDVGKKFHFMQGVDASTFHAVVFSPHQVKSALGNVGWFDPTSEHLTDGTFQPLSLSNDLSNDLSMDVAPDSSQEGMAAQLG